MDDPTADINDSESMMLENTHKIEVFSDTAQTGATLYIRINVICDAVSPCKYMAKIACTVFAPSGSINIGLCLTFSFV